MLPSNAMLDAADDCILEGSVAADSVVANDKDVVDASVKESEDVDAVKCVSIVE